MDKKGLFLFAEYYDATTTTRRVLNASKNLFDSIEFLYWARAGVDRISKEEIFDSVKLESFKKTAQPRSVGVLLLFIKFQWWLFKKLKKRKPTFIVAFTFYTIFPALFYKYFFNRKCAVIYDPRDYVSVSFKINKFVSWIINIIDNIFIKLSDFVIFPDNQYFIYYGKFKLSENKYLIVPNSTEDVYKEIQNIDVRQKYGLSANLHLIPVVGYFSETRGQQVLFSLIEEKHAELQFVFAGDIREETHLQFFKNNSDNVIYLGKIPYLDALALMKEALLVPQLYDPELLNNVYALPTKYYDCLMVGTAVVVSTGQVDVAQEITENNFGWSIDYQDTAALKTVIFDYIKKRDLINPKQLRDYFLKYYDYSLHKKQLRNIYQQFLKKGKVINKDQN